MTIEEAIFAVQTGRSVECTAEEYPDLRVALHEFIAKCLKSNKPEFAATAILEIGRLDKELGYQPDREIV